MARSQEFSPNHLPRRENSRLRKGLSAIALGAALSAAAIGGYDHLHPDAKTNTSRHVDPLHEQGLKSARALTTSLRKEQATHNADLPSATALYGTLLVAATPDHPAFSIENPLVLSAPADFEDKPERLDFKGANLGYIAADDKGRPEVKVIAFTNGMSYLPRPGKRYLFYPLLSIKDKGSGNNGEMYVLQAYDQQPGSTQLEPMKSVADQEIIVGRATFADESYTRQT